MKRHWIMVGCTGCSCAVVASSAIAGDSWAEFSNETSSRLVTDDPTVGVSDQREKDYAWGDFDNDGDTDLVVVRKQPFTTPTGYRNVLFMNEGLSDGQSLNGVMVDRTAELGSAADDGGMGLLDAINERDVAVADVNGDGWVDIITAPAYESGEPKSVSHPRIYINLGDDAGGDWLGFLYEEARIPNMGSHANFCAVAAGDIDNDDDVDLFFVDYDNVAPNSYEDIILINDGNGFFTDETSDRLPSAFASSGFGSGASIADLNNDGWADLVKNEAGPITAIYNNGSGAFTSESTPSSGADYFHSVADLNGDGKTDIIASNDGQDRYLINTTTTVGGTATFQLTQFTYVGGGFDDGFGGNSTVADINQDGSFDVILTDVDVDAGGCGRRTHIYRNLGSSPIPGFQEQSIGGSVVGIPTNMLSGTHDAAPIDINRDGWPDMVLGRCSGTQIWINQPPSGLVFSYPSGLPGFVTPGEETTITLQLGSTGDSEPAVGSAQLHVSINGDPFVSESMSLIGEHLYEAALPAVDCADVVSFYTSGETARGASSTDPPAGQAGAYEAVAAIGEETTLLDQIEEPSDDWTIISDASLLGGEWERAVPIGTIDIFFAAAPSDDATADGDFAFVTENGLVGGTAAASDVDAGPTSLISPVIDLSGTDGSISYSIWFYDGFGSGSGDMSVFVSSDDGDNWTLVESVEDTEAEWQTHTFDVGDFVEPSNEVRVMFEVVDDGSSVVEAGIDNFRVDELVCSDAPCPTDLSGNGSTGAEDLAQLLGAWGPNPGHPADFNGSGTVGAEDLAVLLGAWGDC